MIIAFFDARPHKFNMQMRLVRAMKKAFSITEPIKNEVKMKASDTSKI